MVGCTAICGCRLYLQRVEAKEWSAFCGVGHTGAPSSSLGMSEFFSVVIYLPALLGDFVISIWIANWDKPDHSSEIGKPISPGNNRTTWTLFYFFVNLTRMMPICSWGAKDLSIMFVEHMHGKWPMLPEALICIWTTIVRFLVPLLQGYEDAGDFTVTKRLKTSVQGNLMLYGAVGVVSMIGVFIMVFMGTLHW